MTSVKNKFTYKLSEDHSIPNTQRWQVVKLDMDLEAVEIYHVLQEKHTDSDPRYVCTCPSYKRPCKHVGFIKMFRHRSKGMTEPPLCAYFDPSNNDMKLVLRQ